MSDDVRFKTYGTLSDEVDALNVPLKEKILSMAIAAIVSLILASGPIAIFINCLIFVNYIRLMVFLIALCIIFVIFFMDYMYLHLITRGRIKGLYHLYIPDLFVMSIVVLLAYFILTVIGVI